MYTNATARKSAPHWRGLMFLFLPLLLTTNLYGQTLTYQSQIADFLGGERFNNLQQSNPSYLEFLDGRCEFGYSIVEMSTEKTAGMTVLNEIAYQEWETPSKTGETVLHRLNLIMTPEEFLIRSSQPEFNFLKYKFSFDRREMTYYVLGSTGKVIMIYPTEFINKKLASTN